MSGRIEHQLTKDGSSTLYSHQFGQYYHNPNGAITESRHVFFEMPGTLEILARARQPVSIFELGFGTGLNLLLLLDYFKKGQFQMPVNFFSIEAFPASQAVIESCNYGVLLRQPEFSGYLLNVFSVLKPGWNSFELFQNIPIQLHLFYGDFSQLTAPPYPIDVVFHDPFSPEVNAELWTPETFNKLHDFCRKDALLATYCAATKARAAMAKAGWNIARAPGALGKREMTVASLDEAKLAGFKRLNETRLIERLDAGEFSTTTIE
jgi:tRNA U34 5-methylaminomethyl-2-thiouridine-forming methyltransferase MnmC